MSAVTCQKCGETTDMPFHTCNRTPKAEHSFAAPDGSAACGTVAMLRLPIPARHLKLTVEALTAMYGEGLTMHENPKGWLDIRSPKPPNDKLSHSRD